MKKYLVMVILVLSATACKDTPCSKLKPYTDAAAVGMSRVLTCSGVEAMKADFNTYCANHGLCKQDALLQGPIAMIVCPIIVPMLVDAAVGKLPKEWKCTGAATSTVLTTACNAIPF